MKRTDFLKLIGTGTVGFVLGSTAGNLSDLNYTTTDCVIYDNYLNGVHYQKKNLFKLQPQLNETATLIRDAENPYDFYAAKVVIRHTFIGILPAHENIVVANLLDAGAQLSASVSKIDLNKKIDHYMREAIAVNISTLLLLRIHQIITPKNWQQSDDAIDVYRQRPDLLPDEDYEKYN